MPITHIDASYVRSHFDAIEVGLVDAPRADEMLLALAMTTGPRVHNRAGGLKASEIKARDGLQMKARIRKLAVFLEETREEGGRAVEPPTRRAAAVAVIENPFAGRYVEDLSELMDIGEELGGLLAEKAVAALGIPGERAESYGKAAAVGENGELEHAAAILHPKLGAPVRKALTQGRGADPVVQEARRAPASRSTFRSATRTRPSCAAISTAWRCASTTRRAPMKSWSPSPSPTRAARIRASAA